MRKNFFIIVIPGLIIGVILAVIITTAFKAKSAPEAELLQPVRSSHATAADKQIQSAQSVIQKNSSDPRGYNFLAAAFMQKSRETGDFSFNARAEASLMHSFRVAPDNYEAIKLQANLLLNYHRFQEALETARRAR
jgi:cytochrome c-type biogenesis protein CcmH/NrfG